MGVGDQCHAQVALPSGKTWYPLCRRLGWPQGRSGRVRKISPPTGFDPRTVQPVASRYTDWAILAPYILVHACIKCTYSKCIWWQGKVWNMGRVFSILTANHDESEGQISTVEKWFCTSGSDAAFCMPCKRKWELNFSRGVTRRYHFSPFHF